MPHAFDKKLRNFAVVCAIPPPPPFRAPDSGTVRARACLALCRKQLPRSARKSCPCLKSNAQCKIFYSCYAASFIKLFDPD
eukprot:scaffold17109_cov33-Tisochrysis_lutea.AAC.3